METCLSSLCPVLQALPLWYKVLTEDIRVVTEIQAWLDVLGPQMLTSPGQISIVGRYLGKKNTEEPWVNQ